MNGIKIDRKISSRVLTIGQDFRNHRGGIGGVLEKYATNFEVFNFIASYPSARTKRKFSSLPKFIGAILRIFLFLLKNTNVEIVHIHGAARGSLVRKYIVFLLVKNVMRRKVIFHSHGGVLKDFYYRKGKWVKWMMSNFFNNVDLIICLSSEWITFFEDHFKVKKIVVLENIVDRCTHTKANKNEQAPICFLFLGIICKPKGIYDLLEVIRDNKNEYHGRIKLSIGGAGEVNELLAFIETNDLGGIIQYEGWVVGKEKEDLLKRSDIYILPSYIEGLPLSILEAMTYQMPVIASKVGGIPSIVKEMKNGLLIKAGDKQQIKRSIDYFVEHRRFIEAFGKQSGLLVQPYYAENVIPKLSKIYESLMN